MRYTSGNIVSYSGQQYVAKGVNFIGIVPTNTDYWSRYVCATPAPAPVPTCSTSAAYNNQTRYTTGIMVSYEGRLYKAKGVNFVNILPINTAPVRGLWSPKARETSAICASRSCLVFFAMSHNALWTGSFRMHARALT